MFGDGCVRVLGKAQVEDKLYMAAYKSPDSFKSCKTTVNGDKLLRFNKRIVVPLQFRWFEKLFTHTLIEQVHLEKVHIEKRDPLAGLKGWFWEHQAHEVKEFVKECDECQRAKHQSTALPGLHAVMPTIVSGFKRVAWDFQRPFPESKDADGVVRTALWNILVHRTGYIIMIPVTDTANANHLAKVFVENIYPTTGIPESVLSDHDTRCTSLFWSAVLRALLMEGLMTTAFHPRGNSGIEGCHHIVNMAMATIVDIPQQNWVEFVSHVQFCINHTKSTTTGYTLFKFTMG